MKFSLIALSLAAVCVVALPMCAQTPSSSSSAALPDAPSAVAAPVMVNGQPYVQPTEKQKFWSYAKQMGGPGTLLFTGVGSAISFGRNRPTGWGQDAAGYGQRFGSSLAEKDINATARYLMAEALHEDVRYSICHKCSAREKIRNAVVSEFTARHGADGHRRFSLTMAASGIPGPLISRAVWYPEDLNSTNGNVGSRIATGYASRIGGHLVREFFFDKDKKAKKVPANATAAPVLHREGEAK